MAYLVRDWWPDGQRWVYWTATSLRNAYAEYSGSEPASSADLLGQLSVIGTDDAATSVGVTIPPSSAWSAEGGDLTISFAVRSHTGLWGLSIEVDGELDEDDLLATPLTSGLPDVHWVLVGGDLYPRG
jgi:hypothetical protein